jgi:hypothetical protein
VQLDPGRGSEKKEHTMSTNANHEPQRN